MSCEDKVWLDYKNKFSEIYDESVSSSRLQAAVMNSSHRLLERAFGKDVFFDQVLEVGAGTGHHLPFLRHRFNKYFLTDHNEKTLDIARDKLHGPYGAQISFEVQTGNSLPYPDDTFDRLIATHVLEHIYQPHVALREWKRVIKPGGTISILIPTDPGVAWRLGRNLGPRKSAIKKGIAYDYIMAREHVNPCNNLVALLRHYFPNSIESWWPFRVPLIDANLFFAFHAIVDQFGDYE